jgi:hypothetical protein
MIFKVDTRAYRIEVRGNSESLVQLLLLTRLILIDVPFDHSIGVRISVKHSVVILVQIHPVNGDIKAISHGITQIDSRQEDIILYLGRIL